MAFHQTRLNLMHYGPTVSNSPVLVLAEWIYRIAAKTRFWLYHIGLLRVRKLPVPVISIGNLTVGGTGKTPVVIALAQYLEEQGLKVAVLSRGYGRKSAQKCVEADSPDHGDEPYLIQSQLKYGKVFVGSDRFSTARYAINASNPDIILLDDGYQHIRLHRDLNVLLVDGKRGFGNEHLLPIGPLREPIAEIGRADWVLLTKEQTPIIRGRLQELVQVHLADCPFVANNLWNPSEDAAFSFDHVTDKPAILISGIANPESFESMINTLTQAQVQEHFIFPDHCIYSAENLLPILEKHSDTILITTEKDWVKMERVLPTKWHAEVYVLRIQPIFDWAHIVAPLLAALKVHTHA
jgi:tetraacyldisaccharide 4'-kinase